MVALLILAALFLMAWVAMVAAAFVPPPHKDVLDAIYRDELSNNRSSPPGR